MTIRAPRASAPDSVFLVLLGVLVVFGFVMLTSASSDIATVQRGSSSYYLTHQLLVGLLPGAVGFLVGLFFYYRRLERFATPLLILSIILLLLVFTPLGMSAKGGSRWLSLGSFTFQPSEFLKLTFFIYLAAWISRSGTRGRSVSEGFVPFLALVGGAMLLLVFQPATTVALLIFTASLLMYFTGGARFSFLVAMVLIACLGVSLLIAFTPYRMQRILSFLNPTEDLLGAGYQRNQAEIAIGSGRILGAGFGQSTTKLHYLPEPLGDSIFAIIAEELGFVGALAFVLVFFAFVWRGLYIARRAPDSFGRLLATGFTCLLGLQAFVNIGAISGVLPLTGVPLPFVSYGGTALTVFLTMSGIVANISRYRTR
jgi:cell division protein FtsW